MSMDLGYLTGTLIFAAIFLAAVVVQIRHHSFNKWIYWFTVVATTTVGTTLADFADRSLGIGYLGGTVLLSSLLVLSLLVWRVTCGTIAVDSVNSVRTESFYWVTIMFSQTLGTALGDWTADSEGFGYDGGILLFVGALAVIWLASRFTSISRPCCSGLHLSSPVHSARWWAISSINPSPKAVLSSAVTAHLPHW